MDINNFCVMLNIWTEKHIRCKQRVRV